MGDKKIISEIIKRNERVFEAVVNKYSKLLWRIIANILINASSACEVEECVADVFIYLWEHPEKYDPEKGKLSSWLSMIARSRAIDRFRKVMKEREVSIETIIAGNESFGISESEENESAEKLRECLNRLGDEEREIMIRRFFYEQKNKEIAIAMEMNPKQVENRIYNAKLKLKKMMEE